MDRCVKRVSAQGHDKSSAIAICHASIVKRKERRARRLATLKANYGAKVGETIAGALSRGPGGRFTRGDGSPASGRETIAALTAKPRKGRAGKPRASEAQQAATGEAAGIDSADLAAVRALSKAQNVSEGDANRLVKLGLAERGTDGTLRMASSARGLLRAVQSGDTQGARDALSKGRDKVARESEAAARRTATASKKPKAGGGSSDSKRQAAEAKRAEREQQRAAERNARELRTVTDRTEEIEALVGSDKNLTEAERVKRGNQLDELERRLEGIGGNEELSERIGELRKKLAPQTEKAFAVFKQADGRWRWLARSSNAYEDRDREIVSAKALDTDTARMQVEGAYGPMRFWHVGDVGYTTPLDWRTSFAGSGLDIGACDFSAMDGRMLVESGTFKDGSPAEAIAANPDAWQMSIGFTHPPNEPDASGVYHNVRIFERSLLPRGRAANPFTAIAVSKEATDMASLKEKWAEFVTLFNGDEAKAKEFAAQSAETQKEIEAQGVAFKEGEAASEAAETKAEGVATTPEAGADEGEADGGVFVGDMLAEEFAALLTKSITDAIAPVLTAQAELGKRVEAAEVATKEMREVDKATHEAVTSVLSGFVKTKEATDASMAALDARVKELEGDAPQAGQRAGYRASTDSATITQKQMKQAQPPDELAKMAAFLFGGQPPDAGASA